MKHTPIFSLAYFKSAVFGSEITMYLGYICIQDMCSLGLSCTRFDQLINEINEEDGMH